MRLALPLSQSHRTDLINSAAASDSETTAVTEPNRSQSHRTDLVNSAFGAEMFPALARLSQKESQSAESHERKTDLDPSWPPSQSHRTDLVNSAKVY
jgi:hypothetical protein